MHGWNKAKHISRCLELAILLEVSANKPGNVNRRNGFERTRYDHFLASAVALSPSFEIAAERGIAVSREDLGVDNIEIGLIIRDCAVNVSAWQHGGNTLLGTAILLSPIAVAAGMTSDKEEAFDIQRLRENLKFVVKSTTPEDAVNVYEAIKIANPGGLGKAPDLDVNDPDSIDKIRKEKISLYQIFKLAADYDLVCSEWANNYPITFELAHSSLVSQLKESKTLDDAIVQTFLKVLAGYPDTLITRKTNSEEASRISLMAKEVLRFGVESSSGKQRLSEFDKELRKSSNLLNPGTTADIISAALSLCVLGGYRP
jgi:triphosphoribosyl-dephospho-CoA synthase